MIIYWDMVGGNDGNTGLAINLSKLTFAGVLAAAGGALSPADEVRIVSGGISVVEAGTGNLTFTQDSNIINVPVDLSGVWGVASLIQGPDFRFYFVESANVAGGTLTIYGRYLGSTVNVPNVRRVPRTTVSIGGVNQINGNIDGSAGTEILFTGGWYDSGGGTPAQETFGGKIIPSYLLAPNPDAWRVEGVGETFKNIRFKNLSFGDSGAANQFLFDFDLYDCGADVEDITFESISYANVIKFWKGPLGLNFTINGMVAASSSNPTFILDLYNTADPTGIVFNNFSLLNVDAHKVSGVMFVSNPNTINQKLTINNINMRHFGGYVGPFADFSLWNGINGTNAYFKGVSIQNINCLGAEQSGISFGAKGIAKDDIVPNIVDNFTLSGSGNGSFIFVVVGAAIDMSIRNVSIDTALSLIGSVVLGCGNASATPMVCYNVQTTGVDDSVVAIGNGEIAFTPNLVSNFSFLGIALAGFEDVIPVLSFPAMFRSADDDGGEPGDEIGYLSSLDPATLIPVASGVANKDTSVSVSGKSLRIDAPGYIASSVVLRLPVYCGPALKGNRTLSAKLRKNAAFAAGTLPTLRVTYKNWSGGQLTQQEASVALAGGETDAFFTKTLPFTLTHDQAIEVSLEGLTTNASGKMWLDDFVLA